MNIHSAEYVQSFVKVSDVKLAPLPSIAFIGRSNAGKSTLMNRLLQRKSLVKTSSTPGKTQLIHYFLVNKEMYFIDLPGYGFAKTPLRVRQSWETMIYDFITHAPNLKLACHLVDIRHKPSQADYDFHEHLYIIKQPYCIIANKTDKLPKTKRAKALRDIQQAFSFQKATIFPHSALENIGTNAIWQYINQAILTK